MEHPLKVQADLNRKTSILYFPNGDSAEFYMRGGICWPITYECRGKMENNGFALMAGQDIKTQNIYVFEEISFVTIENILNQATGQIEFHGLSYWLIRCGRNIMPENISGARMRHYTEDTI